MKINNQMDKFLMTIIGVNILVLVKIIKKYNNNSSNKVKEYKMENGYKIK